MMNYHNSKPTNILPLEINIKYTKKQMQRKQQYENDFKNFKEDSQISIDQMLKQQDLAEKQKEVCLRNSKTFELFATCMERHEGKIDNFAKYLSIKMLFIEKQALECYKGNTNDREYERCHQRIESYNQIFIYYYLIIYIYKLYLITYLLQLHDVYNEYYQGLLNL